MIRHVARGASPTRSAGESQATANVTMEACCCLLEVIFGFGIGLRWMAYNAITAALFLGVVHTDRLQASAEYRCISCGPQVTHQ